MFVRIANKEDPDQTALGMQCLPRLFEQTTSVKIIYCRFKNIYIYI